jgi:DNA-binding beta-propeller fold protein YncE
MRSKRRFKISSMPNFLAAAFLVSALLLSPIGAETATELDVSYLYTLSDFYGPLPYNWAGLAVDYEHDEIYVVDARESDVTVFNEMGMEVYRFGGDGSLNGVVDVAVKKDGKILVLSKRSIGTTILVCDFRGEPQSEIALNNFPPDFAGFSPDRLVYREDRLYLVDAAAMRLAVTDARGFFQQGFDLAALVGIEEKDRVTTSIGGFSVAPQGSMLFSIPVLFSVYTLSPDGSLKGFGVSGSAPGKFGVVGDVVADEKGNYYVADRLKSAVLVFDKNFNFLKEFGYRGSRPDNLIGPKNLTLDARGRLYVSQLRSRGISVFKIAYK